MNPDPKKPEEPKKTEPSKTVEKLEGFFSYAKSNTKDTIAYIVLIIGIILLFFQPLFYGQFLIGLVFGLYYVDDIRKIFKDGNTFIEEQGMVRSIVLGVTAIALFISAPGIFLGAALAIILKNLFG
jgi:hypothetical protein